jgi:hypothetical protein
MAVSNSSKVGPADHGGLGQAIKEKPVDADGYRDARNENKLKDGFHFASQTAATMAVRHSGKI